MIKGIIATCFLLIGFTSFSQKKQDLPRPKLVVGLVIDQMRWDYLYRYYNRYGEGGFKRMLREGFTCENTYINYIPSYTAPGHTSIYTGSVPAIHGIAGNDFIVNATGKSMYCTEDALEETVGSTSNAGKMSPRNLLATTITDELKLATNLQSKVIGVALKDRGSILPGGHLANGAYWFDDVSGGWITSTFYMKQLPAWVKDFNDKKLPEKYLKQDWKTLYDVRSYSQSFADSNSYEGKLAGTTSATLPAKTSNAFSKNYYAIRPNPYGNTLTFDFAKAAIEQEKLGVGAVTDFLTISCSSTDYVGHLFGVNALETEDVYLRLDQDIASFFTYLDSKVGKNNYTVFLSADHGAAHNPMLLSDLKIPAGYWSSTQAVKDLNKALSEKYKLDNLIISLSNYQVHFNYQVLAKNNIDEEQLTKDCIKILRGKPGIAFVADARNISEAALPQLLRETVVNGYNSERSGSIAIILQPGFYSGSKGATGTSHGTWNPYDTHIPLVWMGWGIKSGKSNKRYTITDIAPTLAALLRVQEPNGCIGSPIEEVLK